MCYNATASFVTGLIGLFTSWLIYKNRNGNIYFSVFFLSITTMQFLEMVIHLYDCKENEMFSYILHIALISILTAIPLPVNAMPSKIMPMKWSNSMPT